MMTNVDLYLAMYYQCSTDEICDISQLSETTDISVSELNWQYIISCFIEFYGGNIWQTLN